MSARVQRQWGTLPGWTEARAQALATGGLPRAAIEGMAGTSIPGVERVTVEGLLRFAAIVTSERWYKATGAQRRRANRLLRRRGPTFVAGMRRMVGGES